MTTQVSDPFGGRWIVYHASEAYCPEVHNVRRGPWFFQPASFPGQGLPVSVYSHGYPDRRAAEQAALEWADTLASHHRAN